MAAAETPTDSLPAPFPGADGRRVSWARRTVYLLIVLALCGTGIWWASTASYHFATVQSGVLYRSGNNSFRRFKTGLNRAHVRTVVAVIDDKELAAADKPQFNEEFTYLGANGIKLERIPVRLGGWPTSDDVQHFLRTMADAGNRPVLVHCAQGVRRTGMFVAAYQESVLGFDKARAKAAIEGFGHSQKTIGDVERFIDLYDPQAQTIASDTLPLGQEK